MWTDQDNSDYSGRYNGKTMQFFYQKSLQATLRVSSFAEAKKLLKDWARLSLPPEQVQYRQQIADTYLGALIDDVTLGEDGYTYYINGKAVHTI
ncbi:MAG: hypothetical protein ACPGSM_08780 [Thiolinea sp.]